MDSLVVPYRKSLAVVLVSALVFLLAMLLNPTPLTLLPNILNASNPIVKDARSGISYRGTYSNGIEQFQNIYYAQDTSGQNRFAPPAPLKPSPGTIIDATASGAWCPQGVGGPPLPWTSAITNVSENCLSLRIARPSKTDHGARLPVLVWMHGGGDALGSASDKLYDPKGLVRQAKNNRQPVIFIGINYRLGVFGFATSKALVAAKQANNGLRDQRAAFDWVHNNIEAFGGDPRNVIAIGQSVGASSIALHLTSYGGSRGVPFQKAIMMSGASGTNFNIKSDLVASNTAHVAKSVGCTGDPDSQATLQCLRDVPLQTLMDVSVSLARKMRPPFGELAFYPSYDGDYIPDRPSVLLRKGSFVRGIPIIASWVANDGAWYAPSSTNDDQSVLASFQTFILGLSKTSLQQILRLYPLSDFTSLVRAGEAGTAQYYRAAQINRDIWFTCPVIDFTWQYTRYGASNVRLYMGNQTKYGPILRSMGVPEWRVCHLSDIPYILNEDVAAGADNSPAQRDLSAFLSGSAAAVAYTGNPSSSNGRVFKDWRIAFPDQSRRALAQEHPDQMSVYIVGGPAGSGPANVAAGGGSDTAGEREQGLAGQKLFERCGFINSIQDEIGV